MFDEKILLGQGGNLLVKSGREWFLNDFPLLMKAQIYNIFVSFSIPSLLFLTSLFQWRKLEMNWEA